MGCVVLCPHLGTAITENTHSHAVHLHPLLHTATITEVGGGVRREVVAVLPTCVCWEGGQQTVPDIISFLSCTLLTFVCVALTHLIHKPSALSLAVCCAINVYYKSW